MLITETAYVYNTHGVIEKGKYCILLLKLENHTHEHLYIPLCQFPQGLREKEVVTKNTECIRGGEDNMLKI